MINDRRRQERRVPEIPAFIQFSQDDGSKVLNVSEGGVCFEAITPLHVNGPIHFWFSLDLNKRIEAAGELAWIDAARRSGGLRFVELDWEAHGQICEWMRSTSIAEKREVEHIAGAPPRALARGSQASQPNHAPTFVLREQSLHHGSLPDDIGTQRSSLEVQTDTAYFNGTHLVPSERHQAALRKQLIRGVLLGILLSSVVTISAVKVTHRDRRDASVQPASGQAAGTNLQARAEMPASLIVPDSTRSAVASATGKAKRVTPSNYAPDNPPPALAAHRLQSIGLSSGSQETPISGQLRSEVAKKPQKVTATPQQLWSAVQSGNTTAAVTLAGRYIRGDGVPLNCDQARVLLLFASEKGDAEAIKKLQQMDKTECPAP